MDWYHLSYRVRAGLAPALANQRARLAPALAGLEIDEVRNI